MRCSKKTIPVRTGLYALALLSAFVMALSAGCVSTVTPAPATTPTAEPPAISLTTDITRYSPLMSSAFGIHIYAADNMGNPVKGKWTATWGQFCTATSEGGGWKISEPKPEWQDASDIWWQFPLEQNPNGEMPSGISVWFDGSGQRLTLTLEKAANLLVKVSGTPDLTAPPPAVTLSAYPPAWLPGVSSAGGIRLKASGSDGSPISGGWSTQKGFFVRPPFRNADGSISMPDQKPVREMGDQAEVEWIPGDEQLDSGVIEVRFTVAGNATVLLLNFDKDMGVVTIGERFAAFSEEEVRIVKEFSAMIGSGKTTGELLDYAKANIGKLNNGFGAVLADAIINKLENSRQAIDWDTMFTCLDGKEGDELKQFIGIMKSETDKPFVVEGSLEVTLEELADRYMAAQAYVQTYPLRTDWHLFVEDYRNAYLSALLTLNGALFSGDGFSVPESKRDAYNGVISKHAGSELGKLLESWIVLLKREDWKLTDPARDFLTLHGVQGYAR